MRRFLGLLSSLVPISVMEVMYLAAGLWLVGHLARTVFVLLRGSGWAARLRLLAARGLLLVSVLLLLLSGYCWLWGMDYNGQSFAQKSGLEPQPVTADEVRLVAEYFLGEANALSAAVPRDAAGRCAADVGAVLGAYGDLYEGLEGEFPMLQGSSRRPKAMAASRFMSVLGFTGVYFPFTGESNINVDAPVSLLPLTVAHELAHQRGVYAENECNFLGVAACTQSADPVYRYAGYFGGLIYLMNQLYRLDTGAWTQLRARFSPQLEADWQQNNAYWRSFEGKTEEAAGRVYDRYLKANGQELGILSYDACVELIVLYYSPKTEE